MYLQPEDFKKAKENGLAYNIVYKRFYDYGWSVEDAITKPINSYRLFTDEQMEQIEKSDLSYFTIYSRVVKNGMTFEEAISKEKIIPQRKHPAEWVKTAKENGVSPSCFYHRLERGWSAQRAMTTPPMTRQEAGRNACKLINEKRAKKWS